MLRAQANEVGSGVKAFGFLCGVALAASLPVTASAQTIPPRAFDWNGFYAGGSLNYFTGNARANFLDPAGGTARSTFDAPGGSLHVGYNYVTASRFLLGVEADFMFPAALQSDNVILGVSTANSGITERINFLSTARLRAGYAFNNTLVYGTGGFAWAGSDFTRADNVTGDEDTVRKARTGWVVGAGIEHALQPNWSVRVEYLFSHLNSAGTIFDSGTQYASVLDTHMVRLGLSYKLSNQSPAQQPKTDDAPISDSDRWEVRGQATYIQQGYPTFRAPYDGPQSLRGRAQVRQTLTASAFFGVRLWEGGELYYNPEFFQGFGLGDTSGAGGYPNGEAQKSNFLFPRYNTSRLFLRQTYGLGGEQETIESDYGQLGKKVDVSRFTFQVGKFAVHDVFDNNTYAQDSRTDFLNWSIWAAGAFDYPADKVGLTYGAVAELNQKDWAFRSGYFLIGTVPNGNNFDTNLFERGGYVTEVETRYTLSGQPGKFRVLGFLTNSFSGRYRDALNLVALNPALDPTDAIVASRRSNIKIGYALNLEQAITNDIGAFARWSWNNGKNEISAFTDIDASISFGTVFKGTLWGRPEDKIGVATAFNALSKDHREYLAAGGLGILVGDGQLNYRPEHIFETYYAINVAKSTMLTLDYQRLGNPGYNADRGPINVFSGRLRAEF